MLFRNKNSSIWPNKTRHPSITDWFYKYCPRLPQINKDSAVISMGSCFAREIKNWLIEKDYNYILGNEKSDCFSSYKLFPGDQGTLPTEHASVAWERVYNTFTIKNIIDYSINDVEFQERLMNIKGRDNNDYISDILRTRIIYEDLNNAKLDLVNHTHESKKVLANAEIFIITLGLIEIWQNQSNNNVIAAHPGSAYKLPPEYKARVSSFDENLDNLNYCIQSLKDFNPKLKVILTVSPIHLLKTIRENENVITASCYSKSILRVVAEEITNRFDNVFYFPSYEIATIVSQMDEIPSYPDNHHVSKEVVASIMNIFEKATSGKLFG